MRIVINRVVNRMVVHVGSDMRSAFPIVISGESLTTKIGKDFMDVFDEGRRVSSIRKSTILYVEYLRVSDGPFPSPIDPWIGTVTPLFPVPM